MLNKHEPAFPAYPDQYQRGLTKREAFAMAAMQACRARGSHYGSWSDLSKDAVEMADALLAALEAQP